MYMLYCNEEFTHIAFENKIHATMATDILWSLHSCYSAFIVDASTGEIVYERGEVGYKCGE